jgi:hypothetical protein
MKTLRNALRPIGIALIPAAFAVIELALRLR